ncbi:MAG: hypothetical protein ACI80V_003545 [Rhodothermales bacterium]|jgi:hypothetical protein
MTEGHNTKQIWRGASGFLRVLAVSSLVMLVGACEEVVDPVLETGRPFTLFGFLDPGSNQQAIRVFPIEPVLAQTQALPLDATVQVTGPGQPVVFADSIVYYRDGSVGHVFHAGFQPQFGTTYHISARDSRDQETTVTVRTPERAIITLGEAGGILGNVLMPVAIEDAEQILSPRALYTFESTKAPFLWTIPVVYDADVLRSGDSWSVIVDLSRDIGVLFTVAGLTPGLHPIILTDLRVQAFVTTDAWTPPEGTFDRELLVQPGVFSNVDNGFGFVGAGYVEGANTLPAAEVLRLAGFANE